MVPRHADGVYGDLTNKPELRGQNTAPPSEKVFGNHMILKLDPNVCPPGKCPYFDPSYGVAYSGPADFEGNAVAGYARATSRVPDLGRFVAKKIGGSPNISIVP